MIASSLPHAEAFGLTDGLLETGQERMHSRGEPSAEEAA